MASYCDSGSEYGDAEDFSLSQYTTCDKKRKGSPLTDNLIKRQNSLPDYSKLVGKDRKKIPPKSFSENQLYLTRYVKYICQFQTRVPRFTGNT